MLKPGDQKAFPHGTPLYLRGDHLRHPYVLQHAAAFVLTPEDAWENVDSVMVNSAGDGDEFVDPGEVVVTNTCITAIMLGLA